MKPEPISAPSCRAYEQVQIFLEKERIPFEKDVSLAEWTTLRIGGPASFLAHPTCFAHFQKLVPYLRREKVPYAILGRGSNLLVPDEGFSGCIISTRRFSKIRRKGKYLVATSGTPLAKLAQRALEESLTGLEFAIGIPGTVGGALYTNAGVKQEEIADVLVASLVLTSKGEIVKRMKGELQLAYRSSIFQKRREIVLEATFCLQPGRKEEIARKMQEHLEVRKKTQPLSHYNCGSIFKNPLPYYAGELIEKAGLKGVRRGGIEVSQKHANFFVNLHGGTAKDVKNLIAFVKKEVYRSSGIQLECEVEFLKPWK